MYVGSGAQIITSAKLMRQSHRQTTTPLCKGVLTYEPTGTEQGAF
jgi:hypothetical protein